MASAQFEQHRPYLINFAYSMTGSLADAEDMVQDAWLKCRDIDFSGISYPRAYLVKIVSHLCLDYLKSVRKRREKYVGVWLPEPRIEPFDLAEDGDPSKNMEIAEEVSFALLLTLEKLSAAERAAFLLHDVLDYSYDDIAEILNRSAVSCRKLASRARSKIRNKHKLDSWPYVEEKPLATSFLKAVKSGDLTELVEFLAHDAALTIDGGGVKTAILNTIYGRDKIVRFFDGILSKNPFPAAENFQLTSINGAPGFLIRETDGSFQAWQLDWTPHGKLIALRIIANPHKLTGVQENA